MSAPPELPPDGSMAEAFAELRDAIGDLCNRLVIELVDPALDWLDRWHDELLADPSAKDRPPPLDD